MSAAFKLFAIARGLLPPAPRAAGSISALRLAVSPSYRAAQRSRARGRPNCCSPQITTRLAKPARFVSSSFSLTQSSGGIEPGF
jgi:hypothetical protein